MRKLLIAGIILLNACCWWDVEAVLIDRRVTIQPIFVSNGVNRANPNGLLFEAEMDKVWSQAGIDIQFVTPVTITSTLFYDIISNPIGGNNSLLHLTQASGNGANSDPSIVNMWFVNSINGLSSSVQGFTLQTEVPFGFLQTQNGISISSKALTHADTTAHELGHTLGLYDSGNDDANGGTVVSPGERARNLMTETSFPSTAANIYPDGSGFSRLNAAQISRARSITTFVKALPEDEQYQYTPVPEPKEFATLAGAIMLSWAAIKRRFNLGACSRKR